jgi:protein SCO1/2
LNLQGGDAVTIRHRLPLAAACAALLAAIAAQPARAHDGHDHAQAPPPIARAVAQYRLPPVELVRSDGAKVSFPQALDDGRPVALNFIYTSCTAICPVLSHSFAEFQRRLGAERERVHMVSITIDPEEDTPSRLREYAARLEAGAQWEFYTGSTAASTTLQKAFQAWFGDKMHHRPVTFLRAGPGQPWTRLDGFATPDELLREYRRLVPRATGAP